MNILIVDNDMALLKSLEILLEEQGHHVNSFSDPETAVLYIKQQPEVDVLFLDFRMSGMTGQEMLTSLRI